MLKIKPARSRRRPHPGRPAARRWSPTASTAAATAAIVDGVNLRREEAQQRDGRVEEERRRQKDDLVAGLRRREVRRNEGEPDDERRVDAHRDAPRLVEVVRQRARLEGVPRADNNQTDVVRQRRHEAEHGDGARQLDVRFRRDGHVQYDFRR